MMWLALSALLLFAFATGRASKSTIVVFRDITPDLPVAFLPSKRQRRAWAKERR